MTHWNFKTTEQVVLAAINLAHKLYYITDGRADDDIGYFGWFIATKTNILTEGKGQALGKDSLMESLRAKTYGRIAHITFLKHFHIYKNISSPPNQQFYYCDTSTLIKRLQQNQYNKPFPNQCSLADYDVHMTLWSIIDQNLGNLSILHVKGHQDCKKVTCPTKLTWVA